MMERLVPLLDLALLYLIMVVPATVLGKGILVLRRRLSNEVSDFGSSLNYFILIGAVLFPVLWMIGALVHQAESDQLEIACAVGHVTRDLGREGLNLLLATLGGALIFIAFLIFRHYREAREAEALSPSSRQMRRLRDLCAHHPQLARIGHRIVGIAEPDGRICTRGYLRPRIEVSVSVLETLNDDWLVAALLHEVEHLRHRDPLRYLVAHFSSLLNPTSFLLKGEFTRWKRAREVACDRFAVVAGAHPLSLAQALVAVAKNDVSEHQGRVGIHSAGFSWLQVRVRLLLNYTNDPPDNHRPQYFPTPVLMIALPLIIPHYAGTRPLTFLHHSVESALSWSGFL